ncbi:MAG: hypothetical protein DRG83_20405 [Deltaproteobacteria bacterium]|nr:MAG: hypothetical protein DRG83_20405 [Deltaproteobacteria bacterium]
MDNIEKLLKEIKEDRRIWEIRKGDKKYSISFSGKFLDTVGEIFEKHGFGVTKVYLLNQTGRQRVEAQSMLKVLEKLESCPEVRQNRAIGRYVIKTLENLKSMEV